MHALNSLLSRNRMSWFGLRQSLFFFRVAGLGPFGFVTKTMVITQGCFGYC